jgi:hypothetical protein
MIDLQAVYIRDFVRLRDVALASMLRVFASTVSMKENFADVTEARIGGVVTPFFRMPTGDLMLAFPDGVVSDAALLPGSTPANVEVRLTAQRAGVESFSRRVVGDDFTTTVEMDVAPAPDPDWVHLVDPTNMSVESSMLRVSGKDFRKAVAVRIDGVSVPFAVLNQTSLVCTIPADAESIQEISVVASSTKVTGTSYFTYMLGADPREVSGLQKMTGQFIKGLFTTPGSNTFDKEFGAGMQKWAGRRNEQGSSSQAAQAVMQIQRLASQMTVGQLQANLPPEEVLLVAEVTDVAISTVDPTVLEVGLILRNLAGQIASIDMLVGGIAAVAQKAAAGA